MKKANKKGMTIVETIVAFTIIILAFCEGFVAIGIGSNLINSGARCKHARSSVVKDTSTESTEDITITNTNDNTSKTITIKKYESDTSDGKNGYTFQLFE